MSRTRPHKPITVQATLTVGFKKDEDLMSIETQLKGLFVEKDGQFLLVFPDAKTGADVLSRMAMSLQQHVPPDPSAGDGVIHETSNPRMEA